MRFFHLSDSPRATMTVMRSNGSIGTPSGTSTIEPLLRVLNEGTLAVLGIAELIGVKVHRPNAQLSMYFALVWPWWMTAGSTSPAEEAGG